MPGYTFIVNGPKNIPEIINEPLGKYIIDKLRGRNKDDPVDIDAVTNKVQTCEDLLEDTLRAIKVFKSLGLGKGDVVSIISENTLGYNVPILASWCLGIIINPLNPNYTIGELRHALLISKPKVLLCSRTPFDSINKLSEELEFVKVFLFGQDVDNSTEHFENALMNVSVDQSTFELEQVDASKTGCAILLSSGTTGLPKGVLLTQKNVRHIFEVAGDPRYIGISPEDTLLGVLPNFHAYGFLICAASMTLPVKTIVLKKFEPELFLSAIQRYRVNKLHLVPTLVLFLAKSALVSNYELSFIEDILCGGAPVGKEIQKEVIKRIGKLSFRQVYGSTEMTGACAFSPKGVDKGSSIGKLIPELKAKVWDSSTGQNMGPMESGELCFKGPTTMMGYAGIPNNSNIIDEDGYYHSGDIGYYDEEDFFYIVGRIKEVIKYKGFQVSPTELEALLLTHPEVQDCGVIGKPDERAGEVPVAFVVRKTGTDTTEKELVNYVAERISSNKHLYGGVRFIKEIPKNPSGKILRQKLEALL